MEAGHEHANLVGHNAKVMLTEWNPFANFTIASTGLDNTVNVWDIKKEKSRMN